MESSISQLATECLETSHLGTPSPSLSFLSDQPRVIPPFRVIGLGEVVQVGGGIPVGAGDGTEQVRPMPRSLS